MAEASKIKLLLLGTGESGKTTLLKQMKLLYEKQVKDAGFENDANVKAVRTNIVGNLKALILATNDHYKIQNESIKQSELDEFHAYVLDDTNGHNLPQNMIRLLENVWEDEGVQKTWEEFRNLIQVQDALPHFMNKFREIFTDSYVPNEEDWLRVRVRTTGVTETVFSLEGVNFKVVDVGGQRSERRKWINAFSEVTAVIFVVAVNEYDQVLFEDPSQNRLAESLDVFQGLVNGKPLEKVHWIIFFNKSDLYQEKLNKSPIRVIDPKGHEKERFTDFAGPYCPKGENPKSARFKECYDAGIEYFEEKFRDRENPMKPSRIATVHTTCAMDQHRVHVVFNTVKELIITQLLGTQGFIREP